MLTDEFGVNPKILEIALSEPNPALALESLKRELQENDHPPCPHIATASCAPLKWISILACAQVFPGSMSRDA